MAEPSKLLQALRLIAHNEAVGKQKAAIAAPNTGLSRTDRAKLRKRGKAREVDQLEAAEGAITSDAGTRREYLRGRILRLDHASDPDEVLSLTLSALSSRLPVSTEKAFPLFGNVPIRDGQQYSHKLLFPDSRRGGNEMRVGGVKYLVPKTPSDYAALQRLEVLRTPMAEATLQLIESETVANLRELAWLAAHFISHVGIIAPEDVVRDYTGEDDGLLRRNHGKGPRSLRFDLSNKEVVLAPNTPQGRRLHEGLTSLQQRNQRFWRDETDVAADIRRVLETRKEEVISPDGFLTGVPGVVAVRHTWRREGKKIPVLALFERRFADNYWRWVAANLAAVTHIFGGDRLSFHTWSNRDPRELPHIKALLEQGEPESLTKAAPTEPVRMEGVLETSPSEEPKPTPQPQSKRNGETKKKWTPIGGLDALAALR